MNSKHNFHSLPNSFIERIGLLEKLKTLTQHSLALIIAPPGYGKSTLVSQFVQVANIATAWHTLDERDQDLSILFEHTLDALSQIVPEIHNLKPVAGTAPGELATLITDCLQNHLKTDGFYVMDDIHHLLEVPDAKIWLRAFITTLPSNFRLILIGHALPPMRLTEMFAYGKILSIGQEELSFSQEESIRLAEQVGSTLSIDQLNKVASRMLGWPAGTLLALQPLPADIEFSLFEGESGPEALFDALAERLLRAQPLALQSFLLSSSTLSRITPSLCHNVLHLVNALEHLTDALQRNLFITEIPGGMIYHSLFRDFLQRRLLLQNPTQFSQHHMNAGQWFEAENKFDEAFDHYVAAGKIEEAASIAERVAHLFIGQGRPETLLRWKRALDGAQIQTPRFMHMCAMIHNIRFEYDLANLEANAAKAGFQAQGNSNGLIQIALLRANMDNQRGDFQQAINGAEPFSRDFSIPPNLRGYALALVGRAALHQDKLDYALELLQTALPLWRDSGDTFATAHLLMTLQFVYLRLGRFLDAAQCIEEVLSIRRAFGESINIVNALNNLGYHYHLLGKYDQALKTLEEGLQIISRIPENSVEGYIYLTMGDVQRDRGAFDEAAYLYQRSLELIGDTEPFMHATILTSFATLRRWEGKLQEAQHIALEAKTYAEKHDLNWEHRISRLALNAIAVHNQEFDVVREDLQAIIHDWKLHPSPQLVPVLGIYAQGSLLMGDKETAHRLLKLAITNASHQANLQPLFAEIIHIPLLNSFVSLHADRYKDLSAGIKHLQSAQVIHETQPVSDEAGVIPTYSLRVSVLGHENIERDGKAVPKTVWQAKSARKLFYYLLFKGPSSREEIGLSIWPDSSTLEMNRKFHSTLSRARNAIGKNVILFDNELYSINPTIDLWCDAIEFKAVIQQAKLSSPLLAYTENLWHRVVKLYQGDFLTSFDDIWITAYRENLLELYLNGLIALGECMCIRGKPQEAIEILKQALKVDPYREEAHRALLNAYHSLGEHGFIIQHTNELAELFDTDLGVTPSTETVMLTQKLLG